MEEVREEKAVDNELESPIVDKALADVAERIHQLADELGTCRNSKVFYFLLMPMGLEQDLVETVYELLEKDYKGVGRLDVLVTSSGGDIHCAYQLAKLFRRYGSERLSFIVPRYAKSAATVLIFGGDEIVFGPISEMGPLDPQIPVATGVAGDRVQRFSPLAIRPALDLIAEEHEKGHHILVEKLSASLPNALILGQHLKTLETAKHYVKRLLTTRMLKDRPDADVVAERVGDQLTKGYPHHGFCIDYDEAVSLGLNVVNLPDEQWKVVWALWRHVQEFRKRSSQIRQGSSGSDADVLSVSPPA